jgi:GTP:adenosylcobinamide-phosphate guanylyltransferase
MRPKFDGLILAGGGIERDRFAPLDPRIQCKAQIPLLGRPVIDWVVAGLRAADNRIGRIVVVGRASLASAWLTRHGVTLVPEAGDIAANLRAGLQLLSESPRVLALSGDLPLLGGGAVADLLDGAPSADLIFPIVERADVLRDFSSRSWIFVTTPEGRFTGSSTALLTPAVILDRWNWVEQVLNARRTVYRLTALFGAGLALKLFLRRMRIVDAEERISRLLRLTAKGYRFGSAEIAMDIDHYSDIAFAEEYLRERNRTLPDAT